MNGIVKVGDKVLDHSGALAGVNFIEYVVSQKKTFIEMTLVSDEETQIRINAQKCNLLEPNSLLTNQHHDFMDSSTKSDIDRAWTLYAAVKRAVNIGFKNNGSITMICPSSEFARHCLGFKTCSEKEQVSTKCGLIDFVQKILFHFTQNTVK